MSQIGSEITELNILISSSPYLTIFKEFVKKQDHKDLVSFKRESEVCSFGADIFVQSSFSKAEIKEI